MTSKVQVWSALNFSTAKIFESLHFHAERCHLNVSPKQTTSYRSVDELFTLNSLFYFIRCTLNFLIKYILFLKICPTTILSHLTNLGSTMFLARLLWNDELAIWLDEQPTLDVRTSYGVSWTSKEPCMTFDCHLTHHHLHHHDQHPLNQNQHDHDLHCSFHRY